MIRLLAIAILLASCGPCQAASLRLWYCYATALEIETQLIPELATTDEDSPSESSVVVVPSVDSKGGDESTAADASTAGDQGKDRQSIAPDIKNPAPSPQPKPETVIAQKPILVCYTGPNCPPCKAFWNQYETDPKFKRSIDAVCVIKKAQAPAGMKIPTFVLNGARKEGYGSPQDFLNWLNSHLPKEKKQ